MLSGKTTQTLTVTNDMVDTTGVFKAEVYQGGKLIGQDTQSVMDASDPFDLILNPTPEDETIRESGDTVVYKPILVKRGSTTKYKDMTFYFVFMDSAGVVLNPSTSGTAATSGTCTWDMCQQAGGNVAWTIRESGDTVVYKPILVKRGSTTKYKDMTFYFVFMDSAGVVLNPSTSGTAATSGTCTWDMCQQAGGNVAWTITTKE